MDKRLSLAQDKTRVLRIQIGFKVIQISQRPYEEQPAALRTVQKEQAISQSLKPFIISIKNIGGRKLGVVAHTFNPSTQKKTELHEFKVSLI